MAGISARDCQYLVPEAPTVTTVTARRSSTVSVFHIFTHRLVLCTVLSYTASADRYGCVLLDQAWLTWDRIASLLLLCYPGWIEPPTLNLWPALGPGEAALLGIGLLLPFVIDTTASPTRVGWHDETGVRD